MQEGIALHSAQIEMGMSRNTVRCYLREQLFGRSQDRLTPDKRRLWFLHNSGEQVFTGSVHRAGRGDWRFIGAARGSASTVDDLRRDSKQ